MGFADRSLDDQVPSPLASAADETPPSTASRLIPGRASVIEAEALQELKLQALAPVAPALSETSTTASTCISADRAANGA